jgi:hypothetical protein
MSATFDKRLCWECQQKPRVADDDFCADCAEEADRQADVANRQRVERVRDRRRVDGEAFGRELWGAPPTGSSFSNGQAGRFRVRRTIGPPA